MAERSSSSHSSHVDPDGDSDAHSVLSDESWDPRVGAIPTIPLESPVSQGLSQTTRHPEYYFDDGNLRFLVRYNLGSLELSD